MHKKYFKFLLDFERLNLVGWVLAIGLSFSHHLYAAEITGLGHVGGTGGISSSTSYGISDDGAYVVGSSYSGNTEAFTIQNGQIIGLSYLPGGYLHSSASDVSSNGAVIVGSSHTLHGSEAFAYQNGEMTGLGKLSYYFHSSASAVSADGSIIAGSAATELGDVGEASIYQNGEMTALGDLAGGDTYSYATEISGDGNTIVGNGSSTSGTEAFVYQNGQMTGLGDLSGGSFGSSAQGVSSDGNIVVGWGTSASGILSKWPDDRFERFSWRGFCK